MTFRRALPADVPAIEAFLREHVQSSMFPLANLRDYGLDGAQDRSPSFWLKDDGSTIAGLLGLTREGMLMPQMPHATPPDWRAIAPLLAGRRLIGAAGDSEQVRALLPALGLADRPASLDEDEPAFRLSLDDLIVPALPDTRLIRPDQAHRGLMVEWRMAYHREVLGTPENKLERLAEREVDSFLERDTFRILLHGTTPMAMTGFNAVLPEIVQIGGVYTPPGLRGRGYARRAVGLHLEEVRRAGVGAAVLFASGGMAVRAYLAVGFEPAGEFALVLFRDPLEAA